ncbi:hypothetical protein AALP_AA8G463000 [Arabis alpina]|uniref:Kinetochore protein SPC25 n=1 Tax=Arabis alpina TaxID=50452 RepID=A0A087GDT0_ARAAL|nr:hypothetical protein AALP_AA8G463000 [Arabis alpina]
MEQMSSIEEDTVMKKTMSSLKRMCENNINEQRQKIDSFMNMQFQRSIDSLLERAQANNRSQEELVKVKSELSEAENEVLRVLSVKNCKEAKQMAIRGSLTATQSRIEVLGRTLNLQRCKRDDHKAIISQQLQGLSISMDNTGKVIEGKADIQEAISWYNRVLSFSVEVGHGVKFTFVNIHANNPTREFSFIVHYGDGSYTLLDCHPKLNEIKELLQELNTTNNLFRFVRLMRDGFMKTALPNLSIDLENLHQDTSIVHAYASVMSNSSDTSMFDLEKK